MVSERLARMTQRTWAALVAVPLFVALGLYVAVTGLPFVTFAPGPTVNVLGDNDGKPIIEVTGHPTYPDDVLRRIGDTPITAKTDVPALVAAVPPGKSVPITVERDGKRVTVHVAPVSKDGNTLFGIQLQT